MEGVGVVCEIQGQGGDPHRRADAGGVLPGPVGGDAPLEVGQDLAEAPAHPPMGAGVAPFGRGQFEVEARQPGDQVDPAVLQEHVAEARACWVSSVYRPGSLQRYGFFFQARAPST